MPAAVEYITNDRAADYRTLEEAFAREYDERAKRFDRHWKYYRGQMPEPLKLERDGYNDNVILPKVDQLADKGVSFLFGSGISFNAGEGSGQDDPTDQALDNLWRANRGDLLLHKLGLNGAIAGHVAVRLEPREGQPPRIVAINPAHLSVFWDETDYERVLWYRLQYRYANGSGRRVDYVNGLALGTPAEQWWEYAYTIESSVVNWRASADPALLPWTWAPIVDWQNMPVPTDYYGADDVGKALRLNDALNFVASDYNRILKHHGHPRTIGIGMQAGDVVGTEVGGFWTVNKPTGEASVYNLEMASDLGAARELMATLNAEIWQSGRMVDPQTLKDKVGQLTNFGLRVLYSDVLRKTETKRLLYAEGLEQINKRCLEMMGLTVPDTVAIVWPEVLPADEAANSAAVIGELGAGLLSKQAARDKLGIDHEAVEAQLQEESAGQETLGIRLLDAFTKGA
jgi:hypothetical protein